MTTSLDLEELKRRLAEAEVSAAYMLDLERAMYEIGVSLTKRTLIVAAVNALPELIARVERAEKERDRLREAVETVNAAWLGMPSFGSVYETTKHIVKELEPAMWQLQHALTRSTPNV